VRQISSFEDYASIALVLAVVLTGDIMRFGSQFDLNPVREYFKALFYLRSAPVPSDPWFLLHFFLAQLLIMYIPFSKFLHIPGIFYSKLLLWQK
jgi:nitrate reductase gamma subunit